MIYVNQKQLDQVEYLIEQSTRGHHVLFETAVIRKVFARAKGAKSMDELEPLDDDTVVEKHIEDLILQPTLDSKRAFLRKLTPEMFDRVLYTYFSIVENNIFQSQKYSQ